MTSLTFTAHPRVPTDLCPPVSSCEPGSIWGTLEIVFETLGHCFPRVGLTDVDPFLGSPLLLSLPVDFISGQGRAGAVWDPQSRGPPRSGNKTSLTEHGVSLSLSCLLFRKDCEVFFRLPSSTSGRKFPFLGGIRKKEIDPLRPVVVQPDLNILYTSLIQR